MFKKEMRLLLVALLVLLCSPHVLDSLFAQVSFSKPTTYAVGTDARDVTVDDFNFDSKPDLAVANFGSDNVSILINRGDGTFAAAQNFPAGSGPYSLSTADINEDGITDIAVADWSSGEVSILLGNKDGGFQPPQSYRTGVGPRSIVIGSFHPNEDVADVAVVNFVSNTLSILLGVGDGTGILQDARSSDVGNGPRSIALGGLHTLPAPAQDLAVANFDASTVSALIGDGNGTFQRRDWTIGTASGPSAVVIADFDNDGRQDVATANFNTDNVSILIRNHDAPGERGELDPAQNFPAGTRPAAIAVADFDGDGNRDLAVANLNSMDVSILLGKGDGTFQDPINIPVGGQPFAIAVADFNGDNRPDLAVVNVGQNTVSVLLNTTGQ